MIKIYFKTSQTFLDEKCKGGNFTTKEMLVHSLIMHPKYTSFQMNDLDLSVLTSSIEQIKPTRL